MKFFSEALATKCGIDDGKIACSSVARNVYGDMPIYFVRFKDDSTIYHLGSPDNSQLNIFQYPRRVQRAFAKVAGISMRKPDAAKAEYKLIPVRNGKNPVAVVIDEGWGWKCAR